MIICGLDLETTGLDEKIDVITEVGAVLWDTETNQPIKFFNRLMKIEKEVSKEIEYLTGISNELLNKFGECPVLVWKEFKEFIKDAEMFIAHNAPFDRKFISLHVPELADIKKWADSSVDIEFPKEIQTRKLTHLAAEHGFVNPFAHRAVTDVLTMMQVASEYDWKETVKSALTPNVVLRAMVTYNDNQKAKSNGYRWDSEKKAWLKVVKEHKVNDEINNSKNMGFISKRVG